MLTTAKLPLTKTPASDKRASRGNQSSPKARGPQIRPVRKTSTAVEAPMAIATTPIRG